MQKSILICDDDEGILDVTSMVLASYGYKVAPVLNSLEVVEKVNVEKPDMVILDLWMPGINGEQVAETLKNDPTTKDIPILIISASRDGRQIAERCGANDFIEKPFDIKTLINGVKQYI